MPLSGHYISIFKTHENPSSLHLCCLRFSQNIFRWNTGRSSNRPTPHPSGGKKQRQTRQGTLNLGSSEKRFFPFYPSMLTQVLSTLRITGPCYRGVLDVYSRGLGSPNHQFWDPMILRVRIFQHTPGTYPGPLNQQLMEGIPFRYAPGVRWASLRF